MSGNDTHAPVSPSETPDEHLKDARSGDDVKDKSADQTTTNPMPTENSPKKPLIMNARGQKVPISTENTAKQRAKFDAAKSRKRLELNEMLDSTMELEAETYILESLEEQEKHIPPEDRKFLDNVLLPQVPDDAAHSFRVANKADQETNTGSRTLEDDIPKPSKTVANETDRQFSAGAKIAKPTGDRRSSLISAMGEGTKRTIGSTSKVDKPAVAVEGKGGEKPGHRRLLTVEETIFGLTTALNALEDDGAQKSGSEDTISMTQLNQGSGDRLAHTVDLLFRRTRDRAKQKKTKPVKPSGDSNTAGGSGDGEAHAATPSTPTERWEVLRENLGGDYKKTDGDDPPPTAAEYIAQTLETDNDEDVELGKMDTTRPNMENAQHQGTSLMQLPQQPNPNQGKFNPFLYLPFGQHIQDEWDFVQDFLQPRRSFLVVYLKFMFWSILLLLAAAFILYYPADNPPTGTSPSNPKEEASVSWWLLFTIRNITTFSLAVGSEILIIDYIVLNTNLCLRVLGPLMTLLFAGSKGWPFLVGTWAIYDYLFLVGNRPFANHWLYFQDALDIFNEANPSGGVSTSREFQTILGVAVAAGVAVTLKRLAIGLYLGRKTFSNFGEPLAKLLEKMLLISEVSKLAREIENQVWLEELAKDRAYYAPVLTTAHTRTGREIRQRELEAAKISNEDLDQLVSGQDKTAGGETAAQKSAAVEDGLGFERIVTGDGTLSSGDKARIAQLLGQWEDPKFDKPGKLRSVSISAVLQFRNAMASMDTSFPFSKYFGLAGTRGRCVASAQDTYLRLLLETPDTPVVPFETIATIALQQNNELNMEKLKKLIKVFRPERDGSISLLDFVRSTDKVYKELRLLRATIHNSSKIDQAVENIFNFAFYIAFVVVVLYTVGIDPLALFLSFSSVVLAFTFMIGGASASYVEGLLFILVQRPYGIGDRINVSGPNGDSPSSGAQGWIVEDVSLFTTSVVLGATNERATIANGALAKSRIINAGRSVKAVVHFTLKFGLDVQYRKIEVFKAAVEKFVRARPREWLSLLGLRSTRVEADLGFVEYIVILQHRERWQSIGAILSSKAKVQQFALELQKRMEMTFVSPALPVNLNFMQPLPNNIRLPFLQTNNDTGTDGGNKSNTTGSSLLMPLVPTSMVASGTTNSVPAAPMSDLMMAYQTQQDDVFAMFDGE